MTKVLSSLSYLQLEGGPTLMWPRVYKLHKGFLKCLRPDKRFIDSKVCKETYKIEVKNWLTKCLQNIKLYYQYDCTSIFI